MESALAIGTSIARSKNGTNNAGDAIGDRADSG